jgi:hypothetical protein
MLVAHTCNPSYSGGRAQEDHGLKPAWANIVRPYLKKKKTKIPKNHKTRLVEWLNVKALSSNTTTAKKKKKKKKKKPPQKRAGRVQNSGIENKIEIVLTIFSIRKQDTKLYCVDSTLTM